MVPASTLLSRYTRAGRIPNLPYTRSLIRFEQGESDPQKIDECDNFADPQTKYLVGKVWYTV